MIYCAQTVTTEIKMVIMPSLYFRIVRVRETRVTCIFSHILIGLSLLITSVLANIPTSVLYGLFLYVAVTSLFGNQMFERIQLFFTEQVCQIFLKSLIIISYVSFALQIFFMTSVLDLDHFLFDSNVHCISYILK